MIVADIAHLLIGDLGKPLDAEAERGAPQARRAFEIFAARTGIDIDALAARKNARTGFDMLAQIRLRMDQRRDITRMQAVGQMGHGDPPAFTIDFFIEWAPQAPAPDTT